MCDVRCAMGWVSWAFMLWSTGLPLLTAVCCALVCRGQAYLEWDRALFHRVEKAITARLAAAEVTQGLQMRRAAARAKADLVAAMAAAAAEAAAMSAPAATSAMAATAPFPYYFPALAPADIVAPSMPTIPYIGVGPGPPVLVGYAHAPAPPAAPAPPVLF